jgi:hypothetical protein
LSELKYQEFRWSGNYFTGDERQNEIELTLYKSFLCHAAQNYLLAFLVFANYSSRHYVFYGLKIISRFY